MTRMRLTIVVLFVAAFAAGLTLALALGSSAPPSGRRGSFLARELGLTAAQQKQMEEIWSAVGRGGWHEEAERRRALQQQRDEAIRQLVPPERQAELDQALKTYAEQMAELSAQRRKVFEEAVQKTKAILDEGQRRKYEEVLARRSEGRRWGPGREGRGPATAPAGASTQPPGEEIAPPMPASR